MPQVVTLTMNPALDIATSADAVMPTDKIRCGPPRYDPGGGGINVARVIRRLGGDALAIFPAGGAAGTALDTLLDRERLLSCRVPIAGTTRESFTVDERRSGQQYRFVLPGPKLSEEEWRACLAHLARLADGTRFIVASGSLPPGVPADFFQQVADLAKSLETRLVLDTSGDALRQIRSGAYLLKPSLRELKEWVGEDLPDEASQVAAAQSLIARGICEVMVVSLGGHGALLVSAEGAERLAPFRVPVRSAVGAGDCMVGAIVFGLMQGMDLRHAVRLGMAAGAATLMTPGTELCRREDVERLYTAD
ncbi:1-phosphofructokinase family hexose kinase [Microvirga sp. Mcv34]|uniref:1-phosphofructokinase family hexose kinase n=1 Tax=Microvirga sp. Mcv34 TaxID=2926016 RepID=UPI0021C6CBF2|nr:1-phosphofructokinase family hexose kinase [Microvirga sp. Mcv34]